MTEHKAPSPSAEADRLRHDALFKAQEGLADTVALLEGQVSAIKANGWTDEQARDMVAYLFGWRPRDGSTPEGREGL